MVYEHIHRSRNACIMVGCLIYLLGAWSVIGFLDGIYKEYFKDTIESKTGSLLNILSL